MPLFRRAIRVKKRDDGGFELQLAAPVRDMVIGMLRQLDELIADDPTDPRLRRLNPPAYLQDDEHQAAYELLAGEELRTSRHEAAQTAIAAIERGELDEEGVWTLLQATNAVRLVLGTHLDVSDDAPLPDLDRDHPDAPVVAGYELLTDLQYELLLAIDEG